MGIKEKMMAKASGKLGKQIMTILPRLLEVFESIHAQNEIQSKELIRMRILKEKGILSESDMLHQIEIEIDKHQDVMLQE